MPRLGGKIQVLVEVSKICFLLNVIFITCRLLSFQLSGLFLQNVRQISFYFSQKVKLRGLGFSAYKNFPLAVVYQDYWI